jgi:drug/metabolite transporter (DMT)-like permease
MSSRRFYTIGFAVLIAFDTLTQVSFKLTTIHTGEFTPRVAWLVGVFGQPWIWGAIVGYAGAFITWMTLLKHAPVGPAFAASHLEVVTVLIVSVLAFGEHLSLLQGAGAFCILLGIACLSLSADQSSHA